MFSSLSMDYEMFNTHHLQAVLTWVPNSSLWTSWLATFVQIPYLYLQ